MFTPTSEAAFGKGGILRLCFRKTGWHIAVLFYLKRATVMQGRVMVSSVEEGEAEEEEEKCSTGELTSEE